MNAFSILELKISLWFGFPNASRRAFLFAAFFISKTRLHFIGCRSFIAKGHVRVGYSVANALITPLAHYQPFARAPAAQNIFAVRRRNCSTGFRAILRLLYQLRNTYVESGIILKMKDKKDIRNKKLFLFDMDGTIYIDNTLFEKTVELLEYIKDVNGRYMFPTNNSSKGVSDYIKKMNKLGIDSVEDDFLTSVDAAKEYMRGKYRKIYVFGTDSLKEDLAKNGFNITADVEEGIDCLLIGTDQQLTFKKIEDACILLRDEISYIATNPDMVYPSWYGFAPDCGSITELIYHSTGKRPYVCGKPQPAMVNLALEKTGFSKDEAVIIGDRIDTDIACGVNAGIDSAMVLTGASTVEDAMNCEKKPSYIFESIGEIYSVIKE